MTLGRLCLCMSCLLALPCPALLAADMGRMVKALHPNYGRGPFEKMMEVCLSVCKMTKYDKKKTCSLEEVGRTARFLRWALIPQHCFQDSYGMH